MDIVLTSNGLNLSNNHDITLAHLLPKQANSACSLQISNDRFMSLQLLVKDVNSDGIYGMESIYNN